MTIRRLPMTLALAALLALPPLAHAAGDAGGTDAAELRARLAEKHPDFPVDTVRATPVDGVYEVVSGNDVMYMTPDARYLFRGALVDLVHRRNLTAERESALVHRRVDRLDPESMVVFEPKQGPAEHTMTVFTDTTCPYCRQLHQDLMRMIERYPVRVRYLMFPRNGLESAGAEQLRDVWCADDPRAALTRAKSGGTVAAHDPGCDTPIRAHFEAGREIGVDGTPYVLIEDGPVFSGYRPERELLALMGIEPVASGPRTSEAR